MDGQTLRTSEPILCVQATASKKIISSPVSIATLWLIVPPIGVNSQFVALLPPIRCHAIAIQWP